MSKIRDRYLIGEVSPDATEALHALKEENTRLKARLETVRNLVSIPSRSDSDGASSSSEDNESKSIPLRYLLNSERDTTLANHHSAFSSTLHIFHIEYVGIRAAAGSLPGGKLAISSQHSLKTTDIINIITLIEDQNYNCFVLHGYSDNMDILARSIYRSFGKRLYCVWHGNFAQLIYPAERSAFQRWLRLQSEGLVARAHILKKNSSLFLSCGFNPLLLNLPPRWNGKRICLPFTAEDTGVALVPGWPDIRKNLHANLLAAGQTDAIRKIFLYANISSLFPIKKYIETVRFDARTNMEIVASTDIIFNATLIDCHPMSDLEGLACGTPSITTNLFLGELDRHAYSRLTAVDNALDVDAICRVASTVSTTCPVELSAMMADYAASLTLLGIERYMEFLNL